jgi:hypothetical protein
VKLTTHLHLVPRSKNAWSCTSTSQYVFMAWFLVKNRDKFTFKVQHRVRNGPPLVPDMRHASSPHLPTLLLKINSNIILSYKLKSSMVFSIQAFRPNFLYVFITSSVRAKCPIHLILHDFITLIITGELYSLWNSRLLPFSPSYIQIFFSAPCSQSP